MALGRASRRATGSMVAVLLAALLAVAGLLVGPSSAGAGVPTGPVVAASVTSAATGDPLPNIKVDVYGAVYGNLLASGTTDASGSVQVPLAGPATVKVRFSDPAYGYAPVMNGGATTFAGASPVSVTDSTPVSASMVRFRGDLGGTVTDSSASPVSGVKVEVMNAYYGNTVATVYSDGAGQWRANDLWPTTYRVRFTRSGGGDVVVWNGGAVSFPSATPVKVDSNAVTTSDVTVPDPGSITGTVKAGTVPRAGIYVLAIYPSPKNELIGSATTDANGVYTITKLPPGAYKLAFVDPVFFSTPATSLRPEVHPNRDVIDLTAAVAISGGTDVTVTGTGAATVDASLAGMACDPATVHAGANLTGANLTGASLTGCDLSNANLTGANLSGATLAGTNLAGATLNGVRSGGTTGNPTLPTDWTLSGGYLVGPYANLDGADLTGISLDNRNLTGAKLTNGKLPTITGSNLTNVDISGADITDLSGIFSSTATGLRAVNVKESWWGWWWTGCYYGAGYAGPGVGLPSGWYAVATAPSRYDYVNDVYFADSNVLAGPGADLSNLDLRYFSSMTSFECGTVNLAIMRDVPGARLNGSNLSGLTIRGNLAGTSFVNANLTNATFAPQANLTGADLSGANVSGMRLLSAPPYVSTFTGLRAVGLVGTPAELPSGWGVRNGILIGPGADLSNLDLSGIDVSGLDLTGTNLSGATLTGVNLAGANLTGANLTNAVLPNNANLAGANLSSAQLIGINLTGADLTAANLTSAQITGTDLTGAHLAGADLTSAHINGSDFTGADLTGAKLTSASLNGGTFVSADLTGATLTGALLSGTGGLQVPSDFTGATLDGVRSGSVTGTATLPTGWMVFNGYLIGRGAVLTGVNLNGLTYTNGDLSGAELSGTSLVGVDLSGTDLTGVDLTGRNLTSANLTGANLTGVKLTGATLTNATLTNANLTNATVTGATMGGATFTGATFTGIRSGNIPAPPAALPSGWQWTTVKGYLFGPGADLSNEDLSGVIFSSVSLQGTDFTGATLTGIRGTNVSGTPTGLPAGWGVASGPAMLVGPTADLAGLTCSPCDLRGFDLSGANLAGAMFSYADLRGVHLAGADLTQATFDTSSLQGSDFTGANLDRTGFGSSDLTGADWTNATMPFGYAGQFTSTAFYNVNVQGANLAGANFYAVSSGGITGTPAALPAGWSIVGGVLVGP